MTPTKRSCSACGATGPREFLELADIPTQACALWSTRERALACPKGEIVLTLCERCGYIENAAFDPSAAEYNDTYENALHFSQVFQGYADRLARSLVERHALRGKSVVEIGCGDGQFLSTLCELGRNHGVGFDPSYGKLKTNLPLSPLVKVVADNYSERHAGEAADLVLSRQVFEHIPGPARFLHSLRKTLGDRLETVVFFEVPNALRTLRENTVWDIIYEHCSSFTAGSLARVFAASGFDVLEVEEAYDGQFLTIDARPARGPRGSVAFALDDLPALSRTVDAFEAAHRARIETCRRMIDDFAARRKRTVIWGAGARGISFLNILGVREPITHVVDVNPRKHGTFVAGTGQEIVAPAFLRAQPPDVVIVMNPNYTAEIERSLADLGLECQVVHP